MDKQAFGNKAQIRYKQQWLTKRSLITWRQRKDNFIQAITRVCYAIINLQ